MRCPDCSKFVSLDTESDPEITLSIDDEGVVTGSVRITNNCQECSQELTEANFDVELDFSAEVLEHRESFSKEEQKDHDSLDLEDDGGSRVDEYQTKDRNGKQIKSARYQKHLYGAEVEVTVTCKCGETFTQSWSDKIQASAMDSLV